MKHLAVIDFETTGLRAGEDRVIEVAAVMMCDGKVVGTFSELMDPGFRIPGFITDLTGISNAMVRGKPSPESVMPRLRSFLGDHICLAHNASFDQRFFTAEMERAGERHARTFLCSLLLSRRLLQKAPNHQLGTLVRHLQLDAPAGLRAHRALDDVLMTCSLWNHLNGMLRARLNGQAPDAAIVRTLMKKPKALAESYLASVSRR
jgi:DNA polymerase-3 subunit epsilon